MYASAIGVSVIYNNNNPNNTEQLNKLPLGSS